MGNQRGNHHHPERPDHPRILFIQSSVSKVVWKKPRVKERKGDENESRGTVDLPLSVGNGLRRTEGKTSTQE